ncbi:c-type cytochrome [uncultured Hydrogenophaga sp.]|uniref:c-type cytochrome n=1 Tax=uncultured Hydrogenophaga sp. TaxID=199683 RepID=UPI00265DE106|nr:c-type cytochrome [uncultured Hydrogenophaga sp.]
MRFPLSLTAALALGAVLAAPVQAQDMAAAVDLAKASGCYSCHANAEKVVGPAFATIAEKYAGDMDAAATLAQSIQNGSKGKYGRIPMPPHASLGQADLKLLSAWVLTIKP